MHRTPLLVIAGLLLLWPSPRTTRSDDSAPWVQVGNEDGITVSRKKMAGDPVFAYKGEGVLNARIGKLITVSRDTARQPEWVNRMATARIVREITPFDRIVYVRFHCPWPLNDRDFVLESRLMADRTKRTAVFDVHSIQEAALPPDPCCVRGDMHSSHVELKALDEKRTHISAEAYVDPRGALPAWLVNLVQKTFPRKSIQGLLKQVVKPDIVDFFESPRPAPSTSP
jgi:hypothetical protein